jgi:zinc/manganese transport system permease protein
MNADAFNLSLIAPAFIAGLLVLLTHVPLGAQELDRGIVFIDLAIALVAGVGVIAAHTLGWEPQGWAVQATAVGTALAGAMLLTETERRWPEVQEALIGVLFVLSSCISILLLAGHPQGGEHLKDLLVGQVLWVGTAQLAVMAAVTAVVLVGWFGFGKRLGRAGFYVLFALAVTASVQLVGVYLVFASLIVPGLATRGLAGRRRLAVGLALGAAGYAAGLMMSAAWDLPPGAVIVCAMTAVAVVVARFAGATTRRNLA